MRHKKSPKRITKPDVLFGNVLVTKFINRIMLNGKKSVAEKHFYKAFAILKEKGNDPLDTFEKALQNVAPKVEIKARRVGGANYQVPIEVRPERRTALAIRWIVEATRKRPNKEFKTFEEKLAAELLAAVNNEGEAAKKKDVMHRQAEANKAFSHFRW
ncbi:MAG: 30S ribosomal protein S7 [bacterium]|nr:30S ribosomal protein S7 [bacterium]